MTYKSQRKSMTARESRRRFQELLVYVAKQSEGDSTFGAVKLNKILFYSDMQTYAQLGRPVTGEAYQKLERGPAPRCLVPVRESLVKKKAVAVREELTVSGHKRHRVLALREPDLSVFSAAEIRIVDEIMHALRLVDGTQASQLSHFDAGWQAAAMGEDIPYATVFIDLGPLKLAEMQHALSVTPHAERAA